jgi:hypothetical protein
MVVVVGGLERGCGGEEEDKEECGGSGRRRRRRNARSDSMSLT